jgi:hypothetical protein
MDHPIFGGLLLYCIYSYSTFFCVCVVPTGDVGPWLLLLCGGCSLYCRGVLFLVSVCCTVLDSIDRWMMDEDRYKRY